MATDNWHFVTKIAELKEGQPSEYNVNGEWILLFNNDDSWQAYSLRCPHKGGAMRARDVQGAELLCPLHAWLYQLKDDGHEIHGYGNLVQYPTRVDGDELFVEI